MVPRSCVCSCCCCWCPVQCLHPHRPYLALPALWCLSQHCNLGFHQTQHSDLTQVCDRISLHLQQVCFRCIDAHPSSRHVAVVFVVDRLQPSPAAIWEHGLMHSTSACLGACDGPQDSQYGTQPPYSQPTCSSDSLHLASASLCNGHCDALFGGTVTVLAAVQQHSSAAAQPPLPLDLVPCAAQVLCLSHSHAHKPRSVSHCSILLCSLSMLPIYVTNPNCACSAAALLLLSCTHPQAAIPG